MDATTAPAESAITGIREFKAAPKPACSVVHAIPVLQRPRFIPRTAVPGQEPDRSMRQRHAAGDIDNR